MVTGWVGVNVVWVVSVGPCNRMGGWGLVRGFKQAHTYMCVCVWVGMNCIQDFAYVHITFRMGLHARFGCEWLGGWVLCVWRGRWVVEWACGRIGGLVGWV